MAETGTRRMGAGLWALIVALVGIVVLTFLPIPYVIQQPGPVYDTLGAVRTGDDTEIPLISIDNAESYPTEGSLSLTTIEVVGNPNRLPNWLELASAWVNPSRAVVPVEHIFPAGETSETRNERNAVLMDDSQHEATAAALRALDYTVPAEVEVVELVDESPAEGILQAGDLLLSIDGVPLTSTMHLRAHLQEQEGADAELVLLRDGEQLTASVTPEKATAGGATTWVLGVFVTTNYEFPVDVTIQLDNVGGPSAGLMFTLGIIDSLTPGALTGGYEFAGTGTIDSEGNVGPIGGIRQKLYGARDAGAEFFFAPASNCGEVVGNVPSGLQVIRTETLDDALAALDVIAADGDTSTLPTCQTATAG